MLQLEMMNTAIKRYCRQTTLAVMATEKSYVNFRIREYRGGIVSEVCALLAQICAFQHAQYQF